MKKSKYIFIALSFLIIAGLLLSFRSLQTYSIENESDFIVIKSAFFNPTNIYKPNAALLISDEEDISEVEQLFRNNKSFGHACGYHYAIQFWQSPDNPIDDIPFNEECEEFLRDNGKIQTKMKEYIDLLEKSPTHFIYNLQIPVETPPQEVLESFENSGLRLFLMNGNMTHYPLLEFELYQEVPIKESNDRSKWSMEQTNNKLAAAQRMNEIIDRIKSVTRVVSQSEISFPSQTFGGGKITHTGSVVMKFENETDVEEIKEIITQHDGEIVTERIPEYYFVQVVDSAQNISIVKSTLSEYPFIHGVFEYPNQE